MFSLEQTIPVLVKALPKPKQSSLQLPSLSLPSKKLKLTLNCTTQPYRISAPVRAASIYFLLCIGNDGVFKAPCYCARASTSTSGRIFLHSYF